MATTPLPPLLPSPGETVWTPAQWARAWTVEHRRLLRLTTTLRQAPRVGWSVFDPWWNQVQVCQQLRSWAVIRQDATPSSLGPRWHKALTQANRQFSHAWRVLEKGRWFTWLQRQDTPNHPRQHWAQGILAYLDTSGADPRHVRKVSLEHDLRVRQAGLREASLLRPSRHTLLHSAWSADMVNAATPAHAREVRARASQRGLTGALLLPGDDVTVTAASHARRGGHREKMWRHTQRSAHRVGDYEAMLQVRQQWADVVGQRSWVHKQLQEAAVRDVHGLRHWLEDGLDRAGRALARVYPRLEPAAQPYSRTPLAATPWDRGFVQTYGRVHVSNWAYRTLQALPVEHVLARALPEMLAVGGWTTAPLERREQGWRLQARHADGREHTLWLVRPATHHDWWAVNNLSSTQTALCTGWDATTRHVSWEDLRLLAHEIGHVLHVWAIGATSHLDSWNATAKDWCEFPSQLMERWVRDPAVLARWADPIQPARSRNAAYWTRHLRRLGADDLFEAEEELSQSYADLVLHATPDATVATWKQAYITAQEKLRLDTTWLHALPPPSTFIWDDYAGMKYQYHLGRCALACVLPSSTRTTSSSALVAEAMQGFLHHLGSAQAGGPTAFVQHWKAWQGETPMNSALRGQAKLIESWMRRVQPTVPKAVRPEGRWRLR